MWVQPNFRAELGGIVNIESLIQLFGMIRDRAELEAEFVRNLQPRLAKGKVNSDFRLRRRGAAFAQHASGMGNGSAVPILSRLTRARFLELS